MRKLQLSLLLVLFIATACNTGNNSKSEFDKSAKFNEIGALEKKIAKFEKLQGMPEPLQLIELYHEYADACPKDSLSSKYIFKAAQMELNLGESMIAIESLDTLIARYPQAKIAPSALLFEAYILDDRMRRWQKAAEVLDMLIANYPDSEIANDAKAYKLTLGKSPEQIIYEMEQKNKANNE